MAVVLASERSFHLPWGDGEKELRIPADRITAEISFTDLPPIEDPAGALVFGGSPERVLATFVDGEPRYEKGGMEWHELTAAALSARRAMLAAAPAVEPVAARRA